MSHRHLTTLDHLIGSRIRARLLAALLKEPGRHLCFRELMREVGPGVSFVRREAAELERMGLLRHTRAGGALRFEVVTCHPLYAPLRELVRATERMDGGDGPPRKAGPMPYEPRGDEQWTGRR